MATYRGRSLGKLLIEEGLCPANANVLELRVPADGAIIIAYEVFVETSDLVKLARALTRLAEADKGVA